MTSSFLSQNEIEQLLNRLNTDGGVVSEEVATENQVPVQESAYTHEVEKVEFPELQASVVVGTKRMLSQFKNVPVKLSLELGSTVMTVREILGLQKKSLVKLDKLAGDNITLMINGVPVANGEVLVINENFGFRIVSMDVKAGEKEHK